MRAGLVGWMGYDRDKAWTIGRVGGKNCCMCVLFVFLFFACWGSSSSGPCVWLDGLWKRGAGYVQYVEDESCDHT